MHKSSIEEYYHTGRPHGGIGWIITKTLVDRITINFINQNTSTLTLGNEFKLVGTYLPTGKRSNEYQNELLTITDIINNTSIDVIIMGDLNGDVTRINTRRPYKNDRLLDGWLKDEGRIHDMQWISRLYTQRTAHTYKNTQHESMIDYVLLANKQGRNWIKQVNIITPMGEVTNNSDHIPIQTLVEITTPEQITVPNRIEDHGTTKVVEKVKPRQLKWDNMREKLEYERALNKKIQESGFVNKHKIDGSISDAVEELHNIMREAKEEAINIIHVSAEKINKRPRRRKSEMS